MGKFFDRKIFFHFYRSEPAEPPKIISSEIHQHVVLCQLLFIGKKQRCARNLLKNTLHRLCFYLSAQLPRKLCKFRCFTHNIVDR